MNLIDRGQTTTLHKMWADRIEPFNCASVRNMSMNELAHYAEVSQRCVSELARRFNSDEFVTNAEHELETDKVREFSFEEGYKYAMEHKE